MDELTYTATEARNNFFNILTALQMKEVKRVVVIKDKRWRYEIKLIDSKVLK